ncbi:MAG: hypothetical protein JWO69_104 [Thermoleophilia bacterium]|nr:hypothetical protein [Thermoleophilia bacterium]
MAAGLAATNAESSGYRSVMPSSRPRSTTRTPRVLSATALLLCSLTLLAAPQRAAAFEVVEVPFQTCPVFLNVQVARADGSSTCAEPTCAAMRTAEGRPASGCTQPDRSTVVDQRTFITIAATGPAARFVDAPPVAEGVSWVDTLWAITGLALVAATALWFRSRPKQGDARTTQAAQRAST